MFSMRNITACADPAWRAPGGARAPGLSRVNAMKKTNGNGDAVLGRPVHVVIITFSLCRFKVPRAVGELIFASHWLLVT